MCVGDVDKYDIDFDENELVEYLISRGVIVNGSYLEKNS